MVIPLLSWSVDDFLWFGGLILALSAAYGAGRIPLPPLRLPAFLAVVALALYLFDRFVWC